MTDFNRAEFAKWEQESAIKATVTELHSRANLLVEFAEKVRRRADELAAEETGSIRTSRADRAGWAINDMENLLRNLNLNALTRCICQMAVADAAVAANEKAAK